MPLAAGRRALFAAFLPALALVSTPSFAQAQTRGDDPEVASSTKPAGSTGTNSNPTQTRSHPRTWSLALSGGLSARDDGPDGSWEALTLNHRIGRGYVRASAMRYNGTLIQANTALPSDYYIGTLAAGGNFNNWVADGWISYGRQDYGRIRTDSGSRESTGARSSAYYALGADFGRIFTVLPNLYLTPTVAGSYAHGKLLRAAPSSSGFTDLETDEPTFTASATLRLDHAFGKNRTDYVGVLASHHWSSNGTSRVLLGELDLATGTPLSIDSHHIADSWFETGATASLQVTTGLHLDIYATRSFAVAAGNTTSAGLTLRKDF